MRMCVHTNNMYINEKNIKNNGHARLLLLCIPLYVIFSHIIGTFILYMIYDIIEISILSATTGSGTLLVALGVVCLQDGGISGISYELKRKI